MKGVYVIEFDNGIKIGRTNNLMNRIDHYKSPWCRPIKSIWIMECCWPDYAEASIKSFLKENITSDNSTEFITNTPLERVLNVVEGSQFKRPKLTRIHKSFFNKKLHRIL